METKTNKATGEGETMTNAEFCKALKELMDTYNRYARRWLDHHGNMVGFDAWFTSKTTG